MRQVGSFVTADPRVSQFDTVKIQENPFKSTGMHLALVLPVKALVKNNPRKSFYRARNQGVDLPVRLPFGPMGI